MIESVTAAREKLKHLAGAQPPNGFFVSASFSTSRLDDWRQFVPTFINSEFNRLTKEHSWSKEERRQLQADVEYILDTVQYDITPDTQGLAIFANGGERERVELPMRIDNWMTIESSPYVRPIVQALSLLEPFIVARVSRDESSLFLVNEWRLAKEEDLSGPWLRSSDRETGEVSIKKYFAAARQGSLVEHHYKEVGAALAKLLLESSSRRVALSSLHDIGQEFRRALPQALAAHVVAEIPYDAAATDAQMLVAARGALEKARNAEIEVLAKWIEDAVGTGGRGVASFDEIVGAVRRGQVQTLLVERNLRIPGWRCMACDWVGLNYVEFCPVCEDFTVPVSDAVGELVRLTIMQNGRVEVGDNIPTLSALGGVAAVLRFP
jgi:hypothetical protein